MVRSTCSYSLAKGIRIVIGKGPSDHWRVECTGTMSIHRQQCDQFARPHHPNTRSFDRNLTIPFHDVRCLTPPRWGDAPPRLIGAQGPVMAKLTWCCRQHDEALRYRFLLEDTLQPLLGSPRRPASIPSVRSSKLRTFNRADMVLQQDLWILSMYRPIHT